jgi:hypothetical protein
MLAAKDGAGLKNILQLPHLPWPEADIVNGYQPYDGQIPFILDKVRSATRWSYGLAPSQEQYKVIDEIIGNQTEPGISERATRQGFDGILVEKKPYTGSELSDRIRDIESKSFCKLFEDGLRILYLLKSC